MRGRSIPPSSSCPWKEHVAFWRERYGRFYCHVSQEGERPRESQTEIPQCCPDCSLPCRHVLCHGCGRTSEIKWCVDQSHNSRQVLGSSVTCSHETRTAKAHPDARLSSAERPTVLSREISSVYRSREPEVQSLPPLQTKAAHPAASPFLSVLFETMCVLYVLLRLTEALSSSVIMLSGASTDPAPIGFCKHQLLQLGSLAQACFTP